MGKLLGKFWVLKWRVAEDRADHWRSVILSDLAQVQRFTIWLDSQANVIEKQLIEKLEIEQRTRERYRKREKEL